MEGGNGFVKVMTDEQIEILRKQIAAYATISEQLVQLHKSFASLNHTDQLSATGVRLGNMYCDPLISSGNHKISGRQRWTPTPLQLQILERIFEQESGTPSKQKIKEITADLTQHGQISETNVYNWFQNRRARSKRKQQAGGQASNAADSEVETEAESSNENKSKPEEENSHSAEPSTGKPETALLPEGSSRMGGGSSTQTEMPFYDNMLSNPRMEQLIGKMEVPGTYNPYMQQDDFGMAE